MPPSRRHHSARLATPRWPNAPAVAARVIVQVASALEAAHVLAGARRYEASSCWWRRVRVLIDFGATPTGGDTPTPHDIYALTAVLYECLTVSRRCGRGWPPKPAPKPTDVDPAIPADSTG